MTKYILPTVAELKEKTENGSHLFTVVSLFAGGGGSSTGYRMAGGKVLAVNEFIEEAINTYKENWPSTNVINGDIRQISAEDVLSAAGVKKGELDILDGSPPCSAFSSLGKKNKGWGDENKKYSDKDQSNIEDLFFDFVRILDGVQPRVFVAENVAGLTTGSAKGYFNQIIKALRGCGYHVEAKVLDAKHLGVPQQRNRLIFIGVRNDLMRGDYKGELHPKPKRNIVTLMQAFNGIEPTEKELNETNVERFAVYKLLRTLRKGEQHKKAFSLMRADPDSYSPCITATHGILSARNTFHWDLRAFTIRELKRITSIPDDYKLTGTYSQQAERLGRMVPPLMMKEIALSILNTGVLK